MNSALKEVKDKITRVRAHIATLSEGSYEHEIAVEHLKSLNAKYSTISSYLPPIQPPPPARIFNISIKCGISAISNAPKLEKEDPWVWNSLNEKQAKALEHAQNTIREFFFTTTEKHILQLICLSGGVKKSMTDLGFGPLFLLPEFIRKAQGPQLFKAFEEKLLK